MDTKDLRQTVSQPKANCILRFLYNTHIGRVILKVLTLPVISRAVGLFLDSPFSIWLIPIMVKRNHIDLSEYEKQKYESFNDFFTRKIKYPNRKFDMDEKSFVSPCDAKLSVYNIDENSVFKIKDSYYTLDDLLDEEETAHEYEGGLCLIFRLCVDDYHRFFYVDDCYEDGYRFIKGELHTVQPIAFEHYNVYKRNAREYTILVTDNFGTLIQVEVGALLVGKIKNHHKGGKQGRGYEKGMFEFGGSTVVLLVRKDKVIIDEEIVNNTNNNKETVVKAGEIIGRAKE